MANETSKDFTRQENCKLANLITKNNHIAK